MVIIGILPPLPEGGRKYFGPYRDVVEAYSRLEELGWKINEDLECHEKDGAKAIILHIEEDDALSSLSL